MSRVTKTANYYYYYYCGIKSSDENLVDVLELLNQLTCPFPSQHLEYHNKGIIFVGSLHSENKH